jgi:hypothetical protein
LAKLPDIILRTGTALKKCKFFALFQKILKLAEVIWDRSSG